MIWFLKFWFICLVFGHVPHHPFAVEGNIVSSNVYERYWACERCHFVFWDKQEIPSLYPDRKRGEK